MFGTSKKKQNPSADDPMEVPEAHEVLGTPLKPPFPEGMRELIVGMGCFWSPEKLFWQIDGVYTTAVGYAGGETPHPTYREVCNGGTGHAEVVRVVFDPDVVSDRELIEIFWDNHRPSRGMGQGVDRTSQYRSALYATDGDQLELAREIRAKRQDERGGEIGTDIRKDIEFYYAEPYHQQYKAKR
ncbi:MAG: peptide-methionine (S)-S-oxide reductase MsrA [Bradymonadaceae bacterium]